MAHERKSNYQAYVGNVTMRDRSGSWARDKVVWEKGKKYSEAQIAKMLNDAYNRGRREAVDHVRVTLEEMKK